MSRRDAVINLADEASRKRKEKWANDSFADLVLSDRSASGTRQSPVAAKTEGEKSPETTWIEPRKDISFLNLCRAGDTDSSLGKTRVHGVYAEDALKTTDETIRPQNKCHFIYSMIRRSNSERPPVSFAHTIDSTQNLTIFVETTSFRYRVHTIRVLQYCLCMRTFCMNVKCCEHGSTQTSCYFLSTCASYCTKPFGRIHENILFSQ